MKAFELSDELKRLSRMEAQFKDEYCKLRKQVQVDCFLKEQLRNIT
jgi:hypothetical protein